MYIFTILSNKPLNLSYFSLQMQDRLAIFMCNLKPAKMRGILSEAMVMCASTPEKVEILNPPSGSEIGDAVTVIDFPGV